MLKDTKKYDAVIDYLNRQLSPDESTAFEKWLQESPAHKILFEKIKLLWNNTHDPSSKTKEQAWNNFETHIQERKQGFLKRNAFSIAVAASLLVLIASGWFLNSTTHKITSIVTNQDTFRRDTLENGCIIFLYPSSSIELSKSHAYSGEQIINLKGEAFFVVPPNLRKKIKIKIAGASINVTGTTFRVSAIKNQKVSVLVESGQVLIKSNSLISKQIVVQAGEEGNYLEKNNKLSKKTKTENIYIIYQPQALN